MNKLSASIILNNTCDRRCKYCYEPNKGTGILSTTNVASIIERLQQLPQWNQSIEWFGGEPTLSLSVMRDITEKYPQYSYHVITNGFFLRMHENDYKFMKNTTSIAVSLEGNALAYKKLRGGSESEYKERLDKIVELRESGYNISVNVSINKWLSSDLKGFIDFVDAMSMAGIGVHYYGLKSEYGIFDDLTEFVKFLDKLKHNYHDLFLQIIQYGDEESDIEYLCTFDDKIMIGPHMKFIPCMWYESDEYLDIGASNEELLEKYAEKVAVNHKKLWEGCSKCEVELGRCQISCPGWIKQCLDSNRLDLLVLTCSAERIKDLYRKQEKMK